MAWKVLRIKKFMSGSSLAWTWGRLDMANINTMIRREGIHLPSALMRVREATVTMYLSYQGYLGRS